MAAIASIRRLSRRSLGALLGGACLSLALGALPAPTDHATCRNMDLSRPSPDQCQSGHPTRAHGIGATPARSADAATPSVPPDALAALRRYLAAFGRRDYEAMWALLAPDARAGWAGPDRYATFYRLKFAPVRVLKTEVGTPRIERGIVFVPVTLDLAWKTSGPPRVLSLFRDVDATVEHVGKAWLVSAGGPLDPEAPIIPPPHPSPVAVHVPILMYHHVTDAPPPVPSQVGLTVTAHDFAAELAYLASHGYHTIRLTDLFNRLYYGRALPPHPVILSFDDGYDDNYTVAFPLLRRYGMRGEFGIITALPGTTLGVNRYMTWAQIRAMADAGMDMESHTVDHADLGLLSPGRLDYEIHFSHAVLAAHTGRPVQFLTYPSGEPFRSGTAAAQAQVIALLKRYGYVGALLDPAQPGTLQRSWLPYQLMRVRVDRGESLATFAANLEM